MEFQLNDILYRLNQHIFSDNKSIPDELSNLLFDQNLSQKEIALCSSSILASDRSLFTFFEQNSQEKDRLTGNMKKNLYEIISRYIKINHEVVLQYIPKIYEKCMRLFKMETNNSAKASSIGPVLKIIKYYNKTTLKEIIDPEEILNILLDEIKLCKPAATVRGVIWNIIGFVMNVFSIELRDYEVEAQDVAFKELKRQMNSASPEQAVIKGLLKGLKNMVYSCRLENDQIKELYVIAKIGSQPIPSVATYTVVKNSLRLISAHHKLFSKYLIQDAKEIFNLLLQLVKHQNREVKELASDALESVVIEIAEGLQDQTLHKEAFLFMMKKFQDIIENDSDLLSITVCIRAVGIFSKAIALFLGEKQLKKFYNRLIEISRDKIVKIFDEGINATDSTGRSDYKTTFKVILYRQKQLMSFIKSYAHLTENLQEVSEYESQHLYELCLIGVKNHPKLLESYKKYFYDGICLSIMSLQNHQNIFLIWLRKFVHESLIECLKIPENVYFAGEDYKISLKWASQFWQNILSRPKLMSEVVNQTLIDELISYINELINTLDLSYKQHQKNNEEDDKDNQSKYGIIIVDSAYIPNNMNDQQLFFRVALLFDEISSKINQESMKLWIVLLLKNLIIKLRNYPRCISIIKFIKTLFNIIQKINYFSYGTKESNEIEYSLLKFFFKDQFDIQKEYQEQLLLESLKMLLNIPTYIIKHQNHTLLKDICLVLRKSLQLGVQDIYLGYESIECLHRLVDEFQLKDLTDYMMILIPMLSEYLVTPKADDKQVINQEFLSIRESTLNKTKLTEKVLEFLGKIGGYSHLIVRGESTKRSHQMKEFIDENIEKSNNDIMIAWDYEGKVQFHVPLFSKKIELNLTKILPRIIDLAKHGGERQIRVISGELLHSIIIYMIGRTATKADSSQIFGKIYKKIFPSLFELAANVDDLTTKLFNTLALQTVRWFSNSKYYESDNTQSLLDTLMECVSVKENSSLREFSAICIGEFVKWTIKQSSVEELKKNYGNIKSVIRRIESNSSHPDIFVKYGSLLALKNILIPLREEKFLVDKYSIELVQSTIKTLNSPVFIEITAEMLNTIDTVINRLQKMVIKWSTVLVLDSEIRVGCQNLGELINWLFNNMTSYNKLCRKYCIQLWDAYITEYIELSKRLKSYKDYEGIFDKIPKSLKEYMDKNFQGKKIYEDLIKLEYVSPTKSNKTIQNSIKSMHRNLDIVMAQCTAFSFIISKNIYELPKLFQRADFIDLLENLKKFMNFMSRVHYRVIQVGDTGKSQIQILLEDEKFLRKKEETYIHVLDFFLKFDEQGMSELMNYLFENDTDKKSQFILMLIKTLLDPIEYFKQNLREDQIHIMSKQIIKILQNINKTDIYFKKKLLENLFEENKKFDLNNLAASFIGDSRVISPYEMKVTLRGYTILFNEFIDYFHLFQRRHENDIDIQQLFDLIQNILNKIYNHIKKNLNAPTPNSQENIKLLLEFILQFPGSEPKIFASLKNYDQFFTKFQVLLLDYIANNFEKVGKNIVEELRKNDHINNLVLPLAERLLLLPQKSYKIPTLFWLKALGNILVNYTTISQIENQFKIVNELKLNYVLLSQINTEEPNFFQENETYFKYVINLLNQTLQVDKILTLITTSLNVLGILMSFNHKYTEIWSILKPQLQTIQQKYFPIKTHDLKDNSIEEKNFKSLLSALFNIVRVSKRLDPLELMWGLIREAKPKYDKKINGFLEKISSEILIKLPINQFLEQIQKLFQVFFDYYIDDELKDNIRFAVARKIIIPCLNLASEEQVTEVMCQYTEKLLEMTKKPLKEYYVPSEYIIAVRERTCVYYIFDAFFYKLSPEAIKGTIHKRLYGQGSQGNELTKVLLLNCHNAKKSQIEGFSEIESRKADYPHVDFEDLKIQYHCSAYNTLCSIISCTQTKDGPFINFLLQVMRDKGDKLWELLIKEENDYQFEVQTNFQLISLNKTKERVEQTEETRSLLIAEQYLSNSLLTQKDDGKQFLLLDFSAFMKEDQMEIENQQKNYIDISPSKKESVQKTLLEGLEEDEGGNKIELDKLNSHPIMVHLMRVIDIMFKNFSVLNNNNNNNNNMMPQWMVHLQKEVIRDDCPFSTKIFIIKIVINRAEQFAPWAKDWYNVLLSYITLNNNGGKGFHYFLRDVCTTLILWHKTYKPQVNSQLRNNCCIAINKLLKIGADKSKTIFASNFQIVQSLASVWQKYIYFDIDTILRMILMDEKKEGSFLWKMNAIQCIDIAITYNIHLTNNLEEFVKLQDIQATYDNKKLFQSILLQFNNQAKGVHVAAAAILGKFLSHCMRYNISNYREIYENDVVKAMKVVSVENKEKFALMIEALTDKHPSYLANKSMFMDTCNYTVQLSRKPRTSVLRALQKYIDSIQNKLVIAVDIDELCFTFQANYEKIIRDLDTNTQEHFFKIIYSLVQTNTNNSKILTINILPQLAKVYIDSPHENIVMLLFDIIMYVYDTNQNEEDVATASVLLTIAKQYLIKGLNHTLPTVRAKVFEFVNNEARLSINPTQRLLAVLTDLYSTEYEDLWVTTAVPLMLSVAQKSSDFDHKLFDGPLSSNAQFVDYDMKGSAYSFRNLNRSQPFTPIYNITQSYMEATQQKQIERLKAGQNNFIRGTPQLDIFSQTQPQQQFNQYTQSSQSSEIPRLISISSYIEDDILTSSQQGDILMGSQQQQQLETNNMLMPQPRNKKKGNQLSQFLSSNQVNFSQINQLDSNKVRYNEKSAEGAQINNLEEIRKKQREIYLKRQADARQKQIQTVRKYRIGELPDIEISCRDLINPLVFLTQSDNQMASEVFISIFLGILTQEENSEKKVQLKQNLQEILKLSKKYDYTTVSCIHRTLIELCRNTGETFNTKYIADTGKKSYSYHTAALLIEENLINTELEKFDSLIEQQQQQNKGKNTRKKKQNENETKDNLHSASLLNQINFSVQNAQIWSDLIDIYSQLKEDDLLKGLQSIVLAEDEKAQKAFDLKTQKKVDKALIFLEEAIQNEKEQAAQLPQEESLKILRITKYLEDQYKDSLVQLQSWDKLEEKIPYQNEQSNEILPLSGIDKVDMQYLFRIWLNSEDKWRVLKHCVETWQKIPDDKIILDEQFTYELSLLYVTTKDLDKAKYMQSCDNEQFLKIWEKFSTFSSAAKHELVQKIQKMHEFKEFLVLVPSLEQIVDTNEMQRIFNQTIDKWIQRSPSLSYDSIITWNDVTFGRRLFLESCLERYPDLENSFYYAMENVFMHVSKGLIKMDYLGAADSYLTQAIKYRNKRTQNSKTFDITSVKCAIKLKTLEFIDKFKTYVNDQEDDNNSNNSNISLSLFDKMKVMFDDSKKIEIVLQKQSEKYFNQLTQTEQFYLKKIDLKAKENTLYSALDAYRVYNINQQDEDIEELITQKIENLTIQYKKFIEDETNIPNVSLKQKAFKNYAIFNERILRKADFMYDEEDIKIKSDFSDSFIKYFCESMKLGNYSLTLIPRLFEAVGSYESSGKIFQDSSEYIPIWVFLKWIPQLMSLLWTNSAKYFQNIFYKLCWIYPQAIIYPFSVTFDEAGVNISQKQENSEIVKQMSMSLNQLVVHHAFIEALNGLIHPEHRCTTWLSLIKEAYKLPREEKQKAIQKLLKEFEYDIFTLDKKYIGKSIGDYNSRFAVSFKKEYEKLVGKNYAKILNNNYTEDQLNREIGEFGEKLRSNKIPPGKDNLIKYSSWLIDYDCSRESNVELIPEIPGQYIGDREPIPESHVKIQSFDQTTLILGSIRRPKRIKIYGTNEKGYYFLVKGCEDLRLDERIEQLFEVMNDIIQSDTQCNSKQLKISTFGVYPMKKSLGILEWVPNTQPLKELIDKELAQIYQNVPNYSGNNISSQIVTKRMDWLKQKGSRAAQDTSSLHLNLFDIPDKDIIERFRLDQAQYPADVLKKALQNLSSSCEAFIYLRNNFIRNYAVICISGYLLGIGDRHLENFLVNIGTGEIISIDFGFSFGAGLKLTIPELMPFRLTQVFEHLMMPLGIQGIYRNAMIYCMKALRDKKEIILDCLQVFIKDPLLDWIKAAKSKTSQNSQRLFSQSNEQAFTLSNSGGAFEEVGWYPLNKVQLVEYKLNGTKPSSIMLREFTDSKHIEKKYFAKIKEIVIGSKNSLRYSIKGKTLNVTDQIDSLIDLARDPLILGRTWIGWSPFA